MLWSRSSVHTAPPVVLASRRPRFVSATRDTDDRGEYVCSNGGSARARNGSFGPILLVRPGKPASSSAKGSLRAALVWERGSPSISEPTSPTCRGHRGVRRPAASAAEAGRRSARPLRCPWEGGPTAAARGDASGPRGCRGGCPASADGQGPLSGRAAGRAAIPRGIPVRADPAGGRGDFAPHLGETGRPKTVGEALLTERRR